MKRPMALLAAAMLLAAAACAAPGERREVFRVVEENASIVDRSLIRRMSVLEDDVLLIESGAGRLHRVRLLGPCVSITDIMTPVRVAETSMGVDRSTRFIVGGRTCFVRAIEEVERIPRQAAAAEEEGDSE